MPHLIFRGCKLEEVQQINKELLAKLEEVLEIPLDHFTVEFENSIYISNEEYPFVRVLWFDRGPIRREYVTNIITDLLTPFGYSDVCVYFEDLIKKNYFENKKHF